MKISWKQLMDMLSLIKDLIFSHRSIDTNYNISLVTRRKKKLCTFELGS